MKHKVNLAYLVTWIPLTLLLAFTLAPRTADAQPTPNPPGQMSYQGFLVDGNGIPLATNSPANYDVIFRIYNVPIGNNPPLWGELQTVTVDRGYFSVLLGQGSAVPGAPSTNNLTSLFAGPDASDRYIGVTVRGLAGGDVEIQPRMRLLASPYSFLAANANSLVSASGQPVLLTSGNTLIVSNAMQLNNSLTVNGNISGGNVTASGNLSAASLSVNGNITSPKWKMSTAIYYGGCSLPRSGSFTSSGGTLLITACGSGYVTAGGNYTGINVLLDGGTYGGMYMTLNLANVHTAFPPCQLVVSGIPAGNHTIQLTSYNGLIADCNDNNEVTVMELPF